MTICDNLGGTPRPQRRPTATLRRNIGPDWYMTLCRDPGYINNLLVTVDHRGLSYRETIPMLSHVSDPRLVVLRVNQAKDAAIKQIMHHLYPRSDYGDELLKEDLYVLGCI